MFRMKLPGNFTYSCCYNRLQTNISLTITNGIMLFSGISNISIRVLTKCPCTNASRIWTKAALTKAFWEQTHRVGSVLTWKPIASSPSLEHPETYFGEGKAAVVVVDVGQKCTAKGPCHHWMAAVLLSDKLKKDVLGRYGQADPCLLLNDSKIL